MFTIAPMGYIHGKAHHDIRAAHIDELVELIEKQYTENEVTIRDLNKSIYPDYPYEKHEIDGHEIVINHDETTVTLDGKIIYQNTLAQLADADAPALKEEWLKYVIDKYAEVEK